MTRILNTLWVVFMSGMAGVAIVVAVVDVGRPYGQPAGHEPSLFHVSAKGDHQARGALQ